MSDTPTAASPTPPAAMLETRDLARFFDVSRPALQRLLSREGRRTLRAVDGVIPDPETGEGVPVGSLRRAYVS